MNIDAAEIYNCRNIAGFNRLRFNVTLRQIVLVLNNEYAR